METAAFSLFPSLPAELQIHIWHETLPENVEKNVIILQEGVYSGDGSLKARERHSLGIMIVTPS